MQERLYGWPGTDCIGPPPRSACLEGEFVELRVPGGEIPIVDVRRTPSGATLLVDVAGPRFTLQPTSPGLYRISVTAGTSIMMLELVVYPSSALDYPALAFNAREGVPRTEDVKRRILRGIANDARVGEDVADSLFDALPLPLGLPLENYGG